MTTNNNELARILFPHVTMTAGNLEIKYPARSLPQSAMVTRIAPSPTGFIHFGNLFPAMISQQLAKKSGGIFYLRIEDTDSKRKVEGAVDTIINSFSYYGMDFDEGASIVGNNGRYGPYYQSERVNIYHVYAKELVKRGLAYPCFCTAEQLEAMREKQEHKRKLPGYYGEFAVHRDMDFEMVKSLLDQKKPYVLRLRSPGKSGGRISCTDLIKGALELDENYTDHVLLKSDGVPTYHFAHVIDDHLMGTTHVVRGEEWLPSLPLHLQLFELLNFAPPHYLHISLLMKQDGQSRRKLSKRHDPEAALTYYTQKGYPAASVKEYIMTLLNSNFEEWRAKNPEASINEFPFSIRKMSASGALFDIQKLNDVSKNTIARMNALQVLKQVLAWSKQNDPDLYALLNNDKDYALKIFEIGRNTPKPRKDLAMWSEVFGYLSFFYDRTFEICDPFPENISMSDTLEILHSYQKVYDDADDSNVWFDKIRTLAVQHGFAAKPAEYKKQPELYKGHVGDVSMILRVALSGKHNSPDMYSIMQILGKKRTLERLSTACRYIEN